MDKAEPPGVQRLARKAGDFARRPARCGRSAAAGARAIDRVADQRMADMRQMHADLVRAAGGEPAFEQRRRSVLPKRALDPIAGHAPACPRRRATTAIFLRLAGLRPILPAISPAGGAGTPQTTAP